MPHIKDLSRGSWMVVGIVVVAVVVFGGSKIPKLARSLGSARWIVHVSTLAA